MTLARGWKDHVGLIGSSNAFLDAVSQLPALAVSEGRVAIWGETGTGKGLVAAAIHQLSGRAGPFVPVNCVGTPGDLFNREFFGTRRRALTGSTGVRESGLVAAAEGGTLYLNQVQSLSLESQAQLLRFLQVGEYRPLGSTIFVCSDVRVVASSLTDLGQAVAEGSFREDLYYRLNGFPVFLPALRHRRRDVVELADHFLGRRCDASGFSRKRFSPAALALLQAHHWPGNVRELQHVVERAFVQARDTIEIDPSCVRLGGHPPAKLEPFQDAKRRVVKEFERSYLSAILEASDGNIARAARTAGKNRRAFWELLRKHSIDASSFRRQRRATGPTSCSGAKTRIP